MTLTKFPTSIDSRLPKALSNIPWNRAVAAGTLITSACLLLSGKRKAAVAVAVAGTAVALLEDPDSVRKFWDGIPDYVQAGQKFLGRVEGFVEELAEQGTNLRSVLRRG
jgi:hypothetical protein